MAAKSGQPAGLGMYGGEVQVILSHRLHQPGRLHVL